MDTRLFICYNKGTMSKQSKESQNTRKVSPKKNTTGTRAKSTGKRTLALSVAGIVLVILALVMTIGPGGKLFGTGGWFGPKTMHQGDLSPDDIPAYSGEGYIEINGGEAVFTDKEMTTEAYESYSDLDDLGRCGTAEACLGEELMPAGERENISYIHPTGWQSDKYDFIEGGNLYNRSHLIAYSLAGENANEKNLITGTRYLNADVMEPFESMTAHYIRETGNHVMYRVTPIFEGKNLIASGVHMMAKSVEDDGVGIDFNVYIYNVQPGVEIDYKTGANKLATKGTFSGGESQNGSAGEASQSTGKVDATKTQQADGDYDYVINIRSGKFHTPDCEGAIDISAANRREYSGTRQELIDLGYEPCGSCKP